ncbi:MAG: RNA polymerase sigma factor [Bacillota bacterium]
MTDEVLVRRAQTGDVDAVEQLLLAHLPGVVRMLRRLLPAQADADEVAQEACLHALIGLPGLRRPELFGSWLRTIAYNRAMQWQRRRYAEAAAWPRLWEPTAGDGGIPAVADQTDARAALGLLSPADRDALVLRYVEGWTSREIAQVQGTAASTVRWRLQKALERLRATLADQREEEED